jgi:hypothetical protein
MAESEIHRCINLGAAEELKENGYKVKTEAHRVGGGRADIWVQKGI